MDNYILSSSMSPSDAPALLLENKSWVEIPDSNSGVYSSGRVTFNLDSVSNSSDAYFNAKETFIQIPLNLAVRLENTTNGSVVSLFNSADSMANSFVASLKNGSYQIIDKINFKMNQNEVITNDQFENVKINYKILSTWSQDDVVKRGDELHFDKDNVDSFNYDDTEQGLTNNKLNEALFLPTTAYQGEPNLGRRNRMAKTSRCINNFPTGLQALGDDNELQSRYMDNVKVTAAGVVTTVNYTILASFRLSDLHPFFEQMPLVKNASMYLALTLNVNTVHSITITGGGYANQFSVANSTNTCPYMLSHASQANSGGLYLANLNGNLKSCLSVRQVPTSIISASAPHTLSQCLFQACYVKMAPTYNIEYARSPQRDVVWDECYCQQISNIPANQVVSQLISGTFSRLRKVVVMPFLAASANVGLSPLISPVTSEPATGSPIVCVPAISNYNVRVGINNVYPKNIQYAWENYLQEVQGDGAIHGGLDAGLSSGLLTQREWETAYGWRVTNLSRKPEVQDLAGQQITVQFTNSSKMAMDYLVLVYYEKSIGIECEKGLVVL